MLFKSAKTGFSMIGAALLSIAPLAHANHMTTQGLNDQVLVYINLAHDVGSNFHYGYDFSTPSAGAAYANLKTHWVELTAPAGTGLCWEIETKMQGNTGDMDTRIWYYNQSNGAYTSLSDDINGAANRGSLVRAWSFNSYLPVKILPYDNSYNGKDYILSITNLHGITEANCTTNSGKPWVKRINGAAATMGNTN